jgi:hypothetical protein
MKQPQELKAHEVLLTKAAGMVRSKEDVAEMLFLEYMARKFAPGGVASRMIELVTQASHLDVGRAVSFARVPPTALALLAEPEEADEDQTQTPRKRRSYNRKAATPAPAPVARGGKDHLSGQEWQARLFRSAFRNNNVLDTEAYRQHEFVKDYPNGQSPTTTKLYFTLSNLNKRGLFKRIANGKYQVQPAGRKYAAAVLGVRAGDEPAPDPTAADADTDSKITAPAPPPEVVANPMDGLPAMAVRIVTLARRRKSMTITAKDVKAHVKGVGGSKMYDILNNPKIFIPSGEGHFTLLPKYAKSQNGNGIVQPVQPTKVSSANGQLLTEVMKSHALTKPHGEFFADDFYQANLELFKGNPKPKAMGIIGHAAKSLIQEGFMDRKEPGHWAVRDEYLPQAEEA